MPPVRIDVRAATGGYPVLIGYGLAGRLGGLLDEHRVGARRFVVSNPVVWRLHGDQVAGALGGPEVILVPDGERHKHLGTVSQIYDALVRAEADRGSVIVAVGGGVVGDVAGFAAATYLRGIGVVQVPTTLLAQVDASIGGKVGVNLAAGKNLVGAFHPPLLVAADPALLRTLPRREYRAGFYEVIKYAVACSRPLFEAVEPLAAHLSGADDDRIVPIIADCCRIKAGIVSADEREAGPRRVLNFGHTAAHAIEVLTEYERFRHGEAVAWGMLVAAQLSASRGLLPPPEAEAVRALVMALGPLPPVADIAVADMVGAVRRDKKIVEGTLHFVLAAGIGNARVADDVTERELAEALAAVGFDASRTAA
jgi:3-dehydroquinate synthase